MALADAPDQATQELLRLLPPQFKQLSRAESILLLHAPRGLPAPCGPSPDPNDPANDPSKADEWGSERQVHAELIRWLCRDLAAARCIDPKGIQLVAAKIIGPLDLSFCTVRFPLFLFRCCVTEEINVRSASLPGLFLNGSSVQSISADGMHVEGNVDLLGGFTAHGEVRLLGAQIGGNLDCSGGTFKNPPQEGPQSGSTALNADGVNVTGSVFLRDGFAANGGVRLPGAQIGADLDCSGGTFGELVVEGANIVRHLLVALIQDGAKGKMNLTNASAAALIDDEASWPAAGNLYLDGFVYGRITVGPTDAETRLKWLALQPEFKPQPYSQLAKVLREGGHARDARRVLYERERRRRKAEDRSLFSRLISWVFKTTLGYGYYPHRVAVGGLVFLITIGWWFFRQGYLAGAVVPTDRDAYYSFRTHGRPPDHYQRFTAFIYSLENSVPLFNLGQKDLWTPDPSPRGSDRRSDFLRRFRWCQIVLGWLLSTLFVASVTGVVRKE
jgi:hypothetical protein